MAPEILGRVVGCLLAGAVGDALGAPVEFLSIDEIRQRYGPAGVTTLLPPGHFTDDTQMTLFTAEALLRSGMELEATGVCNPIHLLHRSYLRWLLTQGGSIDEIWPDADSEAATRGGLISEAVLHRVEAPGMTCLSALRSGVAGTTSDPINDSKGCGGVMRAAPAGLIVPGAELGAAPAEAYHLGCEVAAITHGHRFGYHPAGLLAALVHLLAAGATPAEAYGEARTLAPDDLREITDAAVALGASGPPTPEVIAIELGGGWVGEEALAIALACSVAAPDMSAGLLASVNHSGDTDSTGAICGNLLGAHLGAEALDRRWVAGLDGAVLVRTVGMDIAQWLLERPPADVPDDRFARLFSLYGA
jgi:ADP-ribosylglycohydrolase